MLIKQRRRRYRTRTCAIELDRRAHRIGCRLGSLDRHDETQMLDLRITHHGIEPVDRSMRHVCSLQTLHPILKGLPHEARIKFQAQCVVFGNAVLARIEPGILTQLRRVERRDQTLPELFQR